MNKESAKFIGFKNETVIVKELFVSFLDNIEKKFNAKKFVTDGDLQSSVIRVIEEGNKREAPVDFIKKVLEEIVSFLEESKDSLDLDDDSVRSFATFVRECIKNRVLH